MVTSRFLFNIGKTSSVLLAASFFVSGFSASQAEAAVNADTNGVQGASSPSEQLIARKPRKKAAKKGRRTVIRKKSTTIITPSSTTVIKESTVVSPAQPTESAPPSPTVEPSAPTQPQSQTERDEPVSQQDLDRLRGLVDSYRTELEGVDGRINKAAKAGGGFSTTTKLNGEAIIGISGYGGVPATITSGKEATILSNRVRLNFDTSFSGKDRLRTRLQSRNTPSFKDATGTSMTRLGFDGGENNVTSVSLLQYSFPLNDTIKVTAETTGAEFNENMNTFNPLLASSGSGSISRFGRYNPIYRLSGDGAALTVNNKLGDSLELSLGYAIPGASGGVSTAATPGVGAAGVGGLFNGSNAAIAQLAFKPSNDLSLGVAYARSYSSDGKNLAGGTGSNGTALRTTGVTSGGGADNPFGGSPTSANHYSVMASYKLGTSAVLSGWYGITEANREATGGGSASSSNWAATLALPDFGSKGNTLGFVVGQQPKLNSVTSSGTAGVADKDTSLHIEALYKMKVSDNVDITPGLLLITNPENNAANGTEYVGTIRTTFKF